MTRPDVSSRSIMAATTVLIARTISISAGAGARIMDSASDEHRNQMAWVSAEQGNSDGGDKLCGCLPQPPNFDLPPPPMPPPSFGDFGSLSEGIDWATALTSDPVLETCQKDVDRWSNNFVDGIFIPKWTGEEGTDGNEKGGGDDFVELTPETPRFFAFLDQPLAVLVIIALALCILFVSLCLLAYYCRRKSSRRACLSCCLGSKKTAAYQDRNRNGGIGNGQRRSKGNGKFLSVVEAASPATTTTIIAPKMAYRPGYSLSNGCDSPEEMSDEEQDHFLAKNGDFGRTTPATDWSYNPIRSTIGTNGKSNGVNTRITSSTLNGTKYGAIPTEPPPFDRAIMHPPLSTMVTRSENGKVLTRASPPVPPRTNRLDHSQLLYDSHNPIYEEISLHDKSSENCMPPRRAPRRLSEGMGNYVDSGASSANSDANFQFADGDDDEDRENMQEGHPPLYYVVDGSNEQNSINSPCCSSGRSECEECCIQDTCNGHNRNACPFSPRPRQRQRPQDFMPAPSVTPSPIRSKLLTTKVNRSTQSGESCLGNDEFNCCECSGRESGYGTEGRRHPTPQRRVGGSKSNGRKTQTMDMAGNRDVTTSKYQNQAVPSSKFYTMRNDRHLNNVHGSPPVMTRKGVNGGKAGSPRYLENGKLSSDDMHLHKSAFV